MNKGELKRRLEVLTHGAPSEKKVNTYNHNEKNFFKLYQLL